MLKNTTNNELGGVNRHCVSVGILETLIDSYNRNNELVCSSTLQTFSTKEASLRRPDSRRLARDRIRRV